MRNVILDLPIWTALSTRQSELALGSDSARRYSVDIGPLAAARDNEESSLTALAALIPPNDTLILLQADPIGEHPKFEITTASTGVQMVATKLVPQEEVAFQIERLTQVDWPAMLELATLTKPGPFKSGTPKLGEFWGIKDKGVLLAMAGERMKLPGYTEVSGVCTHPDGRGRGFARALSAFMTARIFERGETPFLHAYTTNVGAIRLYESLGFQVRSLMNVAVIARRSD